jgi:hypothetical protein
MISDIVSHVPVKTGSGLGSGRDYPYARDTDKTEQKENLRPDSRNLINSCKVAM